MNITAFQIYNGKILISYSQHDYKSYTCPKGDYFFIDGGQEDYFRVGGNLDKCNIVKFKIEEIFDFIREDFKFLNKILKNYKTKELESILGKSKKPFSFSLQLLDYELKYRIKNEKK